MHSITAVVAHGDRKFLPQSFLFKFSGSVHHAGQYDAAIQINQRGAL